MNLAYYSERSAGVNKLDCKVNISDFTFSHTDVVIAMTFSTFFFLVKANEGHLLKYGGLQPSFEAGQEASSLCLSSNVN